MIDRASRLVLPALFCLATITFSSCGTGGPPAPATGAAEPGSDTHPAWSPDGATVAYISNRGGVRAGKPINFEVYRVALDGSADRRLTSNQEFEADVAWSPDGSEIVFKSYRDGNDEVYAMDADGGAQRNLTRSPAADGGASWSPDGSLLVFQSDRDGTGEDRLHLMGPDGSNVRRLPLDPGPGHSPVWSPDGARIAFVSNRDGNGEIYVIDADGSNLRRVTTDPRENGYPRWSPDGTTIAHTAGSFATDRWVVILTDADGGSSRQVVDDADSGNVSWSPDGKRLLFARYSVYGDNGGDDSRLFVLDLDTGRETRVPNR
ncbi:MAG TPA: LpqB family beta-propeller domain-containing protein [Candidatus Polarisedimenticolaceae bacterium]|nr:LpqB family beta-propeller domain-containing protein [Candidatus Polarisedimenticolaceae bacterium]